MKEATRLTDCNSAEFDIALWFELGVDSRWPR